MKHITPDKLEHTLARSLALHEAVQELTECFEPYPELHFELAFQSALLSMEHATAALVLVQNDMEASGMALLRPQFESLVRAFWLMYAASETHVEKLSMPLTIETARRGDDLPMLSEMLKRLEGVPGAPAHIVTQLQEYKEVTWKALNSFTHGGIHPLSKFVTGYPPKLVFDTLCNSNGIFMMAAQLLCITTGIPENQFHWRKLVDEFADCFRPVNKPV